MILTRENLFGIFLIATIFVSEVLRIPLTSYVPFADKAVHIIVAFGGTHYLAKIVDVRLAAVTMFVVLFGVEVWQVFQPDRDADEWDMVANVIGIIAAWLTIRRRVTYNMTQ